MGEKSLKTNIYLCKAMTLSLWRSHESQALPPDLQPFEFPLCDQSLPNVDQRLAPVARLLDETLQHDLERRLIYRWQLRERAENVGCGKGLG